MIDCHAHLAAAVFDADRSEVLARAAAKGVRRVVVVGEHLEDDRRVLEVTGRHPELKPALGMHPDRFADDREPATDTEIDAVIALIEDNRDRLACIGEVGLDYYYAKSEERRELQRTCLQRMTRLARKLDLALNVHSRSAGHYTLDLLADLRPERVLMHAFDGKAGHAERAARQHGFVFSIPPSVVRSEQKQKLVRVLPLESLALESDSPVLGPERTERNEPANIHIVVRAIAELKGVSEQAVRDATDAAARRLFGSALD